MSEETRLTQDERQLIRRYLVWCYKTTKEELDRIDRYFTQLKADRFVLQELTQSEDYAGGNAEYKKRVDHFKDYMAQKESNVLEKKFSDANRGILQPDYQYLKNRFTAVEEAIRHFLGIRELKAIGILYEEEMTERILKAREHT